MNTDETIAARYVYHNVAGVHLQRQALAVLTAHYYTVLSEPEGPLVNDEDKEIVTCGECKNRWDESRDPAPSACCHWCHGRGYSTHPVYAGNTYASN